MMRKIFLFLLFCCSLHAFELQLASESVILINGDTGKVLFEKNAREKLYPASLTKIATAHYTLLLRGNKLDKKIIAERDSVASISDKQMQRSNYTLPSYWLTPGTSHIGIKTGEELTLKDLLYGTLVASGGDAANVMANYMGGSIPVFMDELNAYLKKIGCKDTLFKNPHGLHHPDHQTTAFDLAILTKEAMKNATFREIVKTVNYTRPETNKQPATTLVQTNRLLRKGKHFYSKAIGVKTGFTTPAKSCLAAAAKDKDRMLIAILMKAPDRDSVLDDAIKLFKKAFEEKPVQKKLVPKGIQNALLSLPHSESSVKTYTKEDVAIEYYSSEDPKFKCLVEWDPVTLPVFKDQVVGFLAIQDENGAIVKKEPLFAENGVDFGSWYRLKNYLSSKPFLKVIGSILGIFLITALFYELLKNKSRN